jgi:hypothetical protein
MMPCRKEKKGTSRVRIGAMVFLAGAVFVFVQLHMFRGDLVSAGDQRYSGSFLPGYANVEVADDSLPVAATDGSARVADVTSKFLTSTFPAACTNHQLETIGFQLPAGECHAMSQRPWRKGGCVLFPTPVDAPKAIG